MPELVSEGPRIPVHLMNEVDEGSVVFFCGAGVWTLLTKVETSCDRILIAGGANVEAEWEQGPAV